jgi:16S rRNA (guanine966-N2)-methyltransferase
MRQSLFSQLQGDMPGSRVLDLFAGTGAFGLEALSQGAREVVFVEQDRQTALILERNIRNLGFRHQSTVVVADALSSEALDTLPITETFSLVFVDPPFRIFENAEQTRDFGQQISSLLARDFLTDDSMMILRMPRRALENLGVSPMKSKVYGRSIIAFFSRLTEE